MSALAKRPVKILIGLAVLGLIGIVGGPYVYIHFIKEKAPAPLSFDALSTAAGESAAATDAASADTAAVDTAAADSAATETAAADTATADTAAADTAAAAATGDASSIEGTWKVTQPATAGYRVKEVLFGQSTEGVGRTTGIEGTVTIAGSELTEGTFTVDLTTLASDADRRDAQVQGRLLETAQFPKATFTVKGPVTLPATPEVGKIVSLDVPGTLNLHGVDKDITFPLQVKRTDAGFEVAGSVTITFADFSIENPTNPAVQTEDHGLLELAMTFAKG